MQGMAASLYSFVDKYLYWFNLPKITVIDVIEIIIIAIVLYYVMAWIKNSRAWALLRGIIIILVFIAVAAIFRMNTILWLVTQLFSIALIALVIIFQPELRTALENLGRRNLLARLFRIDPYRNSSYISEKSITEIVRACLEMGSAKTGALIVVEGNQELGEYIRTGIELDSVISSQLLINIFEEKTPLHDGAVIVRGDRIVAATCYLPLSDNLKLSKDLGTRHRAAVGMSEASDSLTIVVSEETGEISVAVDRKLYRDVDDDFLRERLERMSKNGEQSGTFAGRIRGRSINQTEESRRDASSSDESERRADHVEKTGKTDHK